MEWDDRRVIEAVVFDMDGVLLDSEPQWAEARERFTWENGGRWDRGAQREMMGMSAREWSRYMREELLVPLEPEEISAGVLWRMEQLYRERLPLIDGAPEAVRRLGRWPLGLASSSNRPLIDVALELARLDLLFQATVSSDEVPRGKPAPDVYLEAARRLGRNATSCAAIEDSHNGILSARAAGMRVIVVPNAVFPPGPEALAEVDALVGSLDELEPAMVDPSIT
jgi:HAD superfamily hydrolase (TIGR01509 family)